MGALFNTWTAATNSLPDKIKYFVQLFWDVFMMTPLRVYRKWKILVQCRVHKHPSHFPLAFFASSSFLFVSWNQHVRTSELPFVHTHLNKTRSYATRASCIFAAKSATLRSIFKKCSGTKLGVEEIFERRFLNGLQGTLSQNIRHFSFWEDAVLVTSNLVW